MQIFRGITRKNKLPDRVIVTLADFAFWLSLFCLKLNNFQIKQVTNFNPNKSCLMWNILAD